VKPHQLDVLLEIPMSQADRMARDRGAIGPEIVDMSRWRAEELCREAGGTLRTDRTPEFTMSEGQSPLLGDMLLVGSRWWAEVPENFVPDATG